MENLDIDKVIEGLSNPAIGANSIDLMSMLDEFNKVLGKVQKTMNMMETMGLKPLIVRAAADKLGVDGETPLRSEVAAGVAPQSEYHKQVFQQFNQMSEQQLAEFMSAILNPDVKEALVEPKQESEPEPETEE